MRGEGFVLDCCCRPSKREKKKKSVQCFAKNVKERKEEREINPKCKRASDKEHRRLKSIPGNGNG